MVAERPQSSNIDEKSRKIGELESEVKNLKGKVKDQESKIKDKVDNDDFCCCLACTVAAIFLLSSNSDGATLQKNKYTGEPTKVGETVEYNQEGFLLRHIENYQKNLSPQLKERLGTDKICRYTPSCSEYAKQAIEKRGSVKGSLLATKRLLKCNPLSKGGYDPVK